MASYFFTSKQAGNFGIESGEKLISRALHLMLRTDQLGAFDHSLQLCRCEVAAEKCTCGHPAGACSGAILALLASGAVSLRGFREAHLRPLAVYSLADAPSKNAQIGGE